LFDAEQSKKKRPAHVCARASHHGTSLCWVDRGAGDHDLRNDEVRLVLASILMPSPRRFPPPWSVEDIGAVLKQQSRRRRRKPTALPYRPKTVPWSCRNGVVGVIEPTVRNSPLRLTRRNGQPRSGRPVRLRKDSTNLLRRGGRRSFFPAKLLPVDQVFLRKEPKDGILAFARASAGSIILGGTR